MKFEIVNGNRHRWLVDYKCFDKKHVNINQQWDNIKERKVCNKCSNTNIDWNIERLNRLLNKCEFTLINPIVQDIKATSVIHLQDKYDFFYKTTPHLLNRSTKTSALSPLRQSYKLYKTLNIRNWVKIFKPEYIITNTDDELEVSNSKSKFDFEYINDQLCEGSIKTFKCSFSKFKAGQIHPGFKNTSKGERFIQSSLFSKNIQFYPHYPIKIDGKNFYFDICILDSENRENCFIEFHGIQHYKPIPFFGGEKGLNTRIKYDEMKAVYSLNNNIKLFVFDKSNITTFEDTISEWLLTVKR